MLPTLREEPDSAASRIGDHWMMRTILPAAAAAVLVPIAVGVRADDAPAPLPLHDVVLFSSGVGYFQRAGRINGSTSVPLSFRVEQVNDILKSLVLFDPE